MKVRNKKIAETAILKRMFVNFALKSKGFVIAL